MSRNSDGIFAEFFPFSQPDSAGKTDRNVSPTYFASQEFIISSDGLARRIRSDIHRKIEPIEKKLPFSLEDLYSGAQRKIKISRTIPDAHGKPTTEEEILTVNVKPGWKKGTRITFLEKGNQDPGTIAGDIIFLVDEKPHAVYKRDGNDLLVNKKISLLDSLTGKTIKLTTLDGRILTILLTDIIKPGDEMVIGNEGMPISKEPGKKGSLKIKFDVKYPSMFTEEQKSDLRRVLGPC